MRYASISLSAALLLSGCNQAPPVAEKPAAVITSPASAPAPAAAVAPASAPTDPAVPAAPAAPAPALHQAAPLKMSFRFTPASDPDNPAQPRTSAHLLLQGATPLDIDLGKFAGRPDVVDAAKARLANFPAGMLLGFRSYQAATGTSADLAVLLVDGRRLRVVQRRVEETASEAGKFETAREIPLPPDTRVVVAKK